MLRRAKYYLQNIHADLPASIVVVLVAIPLCLGIAMGSNAPLFSGLIAGMIGGILIGILSGSHLSVSGPAAGLTAIVIVALGKLPSFEAFLLSVFICGILQIILGYLKAGILGDYGGRRDSPKSSSPRCQASRNNMSVGSSGDGATLPW